LKGHGEAKGHLVALFTILVWGNTFISTKILLGTFTPIEILVIRFVMGYLALWMFSPRLLRVKEKKQEPLFICAGIAGVTLYYLLENIALTFTNAGNVGVLVTVAPFFTAILSVWFLKAEKPGVQFYPGFATAITGIGLISFHGAGVLRLNPLGDLLAFLAAIVWAVYSVLIRKISAFGYPTILVTRRIFFYGLIFMTPALFFMDFSPELEQFASPLIAGNYLFLGACACALCFVTWNTAVKWLGAVRTSVYIYLSPVVTVAASTLILHEPLTPMLLAGAGLILLGLWISETKIFRKWKIRRRTISEAKEEGDEQTCSKSNI
jgi:drug/metabolite transporter (DMT)-like permease